MWQYPLDKRNFYGILPALLKKANNSKVEFFMKNKYNDNKLAEELDTIVLVGDKHACHGLPDGSLGTLTYSYTGMNRPLYAEFALDDGTRLEEALDLQDFRVVNERDEHDLSLLVAYLRKEARKKQIREIASSERLGRA